tara:strand:- start:6410 stop:9538 length:3129 start_codon:yes stop_codon:yes gene_type:complete
VVLLFAIGTPACQCGSNLISPDNWGKRLLSTDLPDDTLQFPEQFVRGARTREFLLYNDGKEDLVVASYEVLKTKTSFKIVKAPELPFTLKPGQKHGVKISVEFTKDNAGEFEGSIAFFSPHTNNTDASDKFYVTLKGTYRKIGPEFQCGEVLDFGAVEKGETKILECEILNQGTAELIIQGFQYEREEGGKNNDFRWVGPAFPIRIPPNRTESKTIRIAYTPSDYPPAEDKGAFVLESNLPITEQASKPRLKVVGKMAIALVQIIPLYPGCKEDKSCQDIDERLFCQEDKAGQQTLCQVKEGETPLLKFPYTRRGKATTRSFLIRSVGEVPLKVSTLQFVAPTSSEFVIPPEFLKPFTLEPSKERIITLQYTPKDAVVDKGTLRVFSNDVEKPEADVLLEGTPTGCDLEVKPLEITFPIPSDPNKPDSYPVNLTNYGNAPCILSSIYMKSGLDDPYKMASLPKPDAKIEPNGSLSFTVAYHPYGRREIDYIQIESDDDDEPLLEVKLIPPPEDPPRCELEAEPPIVLFHEVSVGRQKTLPVTLSNKGNATCVITSLRFDGTNPPGNTVFSQGNPRSPLPLRIAPGGSADVPVMYQPKSKRSVYEGKLLVVSNDPKNGTLPVDLKGTQGRRCLEVVPGKLDFGNARFGCKTPTQKVTVYHLGLSGCPSSVQVTKALLSKTTSSEFEVVNLPKLPYTLNAGGTPFVAELVYKAKDYGKDAGTLLIENSYALQSPLLVPLAGNGVSSQKQRDVFQQVQRPQADILFVIDNSCSMREEQRSLGSNFSSFIKWAIKLNVDYHIGVTTTDNSTRGGNTPGCLRSLGGGNGRFLTPNTRNKETIFSAAVNVGTSGSPIEQGLEGAFQALSQPVIDDPRCNKGFYRKNASLSIIIVSDEKDQSPQPLNFYVDFFKNLKGTRNVSQVRGSVVAGPPPRGCRNTGTGRATAAPRYWDFAKRLGGVQTSICREDWGQTLNDLGSVSFGFRRQFFLTRKPDARTIVVRVNGKQIAEHHINGWIYDSVSNSILFSASSTPTQGAFITVDYQSICL